MEYIPGKFESIKFESKKEGYYKALAEMKGMDIPFEDILHHFPAFVGHMTLSRYLALYEAYKMTLGVSGHVAELGVYKAAGTLLFAKLCEIFEPGSLTQVHGFDWFKGMAPTDEEPNVKKGSYQVDYSLVKKLIDTQGLGHVVRIHNIDLESDLDAFFQENSHLQFKLIFLDAGLYSIVKNSIKYFWGRLSKGGVLILDQYNFELGPGETRAVKELLPDMKIQTFPFSWLPSAYIVK